MIKPGEVTEREAEVLAALGAHMSNSQISHRLHISVRTVESHVSALLRKLGAADRRELAAMAAPDVEAVPYAPHRLPGLPQYRTSFVGRVDERNQTATSLANDRLVTLVGPGGVGKSRLAVAVAEEVGVRYRHAGAFVDLVPVHDGLIMQAVAAALNLTESPHRALEDIIADQIGADRALLVLDNCEHLVGSAAALVDRLLDSCAALRVIATSRERLAVPGEKVIAVRPLPLGSDAEALFVERVQGTALDATSDQEAITEICGRLGGLPLAIELAAARSASLGLAGLTSGLHDQLRLLVGARGGDPRHSSVREVVAWSHGLLDDSEHWLFRHLGVFTGAFDLDSVTAIVACDRAVAADLLGQLADKSIVEHVSGEHTRWRMLETVRAFAAEKLAASTDAGPAHERFIGWAASVAVSLERLLEDDWDNDWQDAFDAIVPDLRAALAATAAEPAETPHRLARALAHLTYARRFLGESLGHYRAAAARAPSPADAAHDLWMAANCCNAVFGASDQASGLLYDALQAARHGGDVSALARAASAAVITSVRRLGDVPTDTADMIAEVLARLPPTDSLSDDRIAACLTVAKAWTSADEPYAVDRQHADTALAAARAAGDPVVISSALEVVITSAVVDGELQRAHHLCAERLALLESMPRSDPVSAPEIVDAFHVASRCAVAAGDLPAALEMGRRMLKDDLVGGNSHVCRSNTVLPFALSGQFDEALSHVTAAWDEATSAGGDGAGTLVPFVLAATLVHGLRHDETRHRIWRARLPPARGEPFDHSALTVYVNARIAAHRGDLAMAGSIVDRAFSNTPPSFYKCYAHAAAAELAALARLPNAEHYLSILEDSDSRWAHACAARARGRLGDADALAESVLLWERMGARFERAITLLLSMDRAEEGRAELDALGIQPR